MLTKHKQLEVVNACYANVAHRFAMYANPNFRGEGFTWEWFILSCEKDASLWMMIHNVRGKNSTIHAEINKTAKKYARAIAEKLVGIVTSADPQ